MFWLVIDLIIQHQFCKYKWLGYIYSVYNYYKHRYTRKAQFINICHHFKVMYVVTIGHHWRNKKHVFYIKLYIKLYTLYKLWNRHSVRLYTVKFFHAISNWPNIFLALLRTTTVDVTTSCICIRKSPFTPHLE